MMRNKFNVLETLARAVKRESHREASLRVWQSAGEGMDVGH